MSYFARTDEGDLAFPRVVVTDPAQCARQQAVDILSLWYTEYFLDQSIGFPWQELLGLKIVSTTEIEAVLQQALLSVTGAVSVTTDVNFDRAQRAFSYSFEMILNTGAIVTGGSNQAFQVQSQGSTGTA
jgi:hypothetical protein